MVESAEAHTVRKQIKHDNLVTLVIILWKVLATSLHKECDSGERAVHYMDVDRAGEVG